MYDMLKTKKYSGVDTPQRKHLRQVRIEFKIGSSKRTKILRHRPFPYKVNTRRAEELIFGVNSALICVKMLSPLLVMTSSQFDRVNIFHLVAKCLKIAWTKFRCLTCLVVFLL